MPAGNRSRFRILLSLISSILCIAGLITIIVSYWHGMGHEGRNKLPTNGPHNVHQSLIMIHRGIVFLHKSDVYVGPDALDDFVRPLPEGWPYSLKSMIEEAHKEYGRGPIWKRLGFRFDTESKRVRSTTMTFSLWPFVMLLGALPMVELAKMRRQRRRLARGQCGRCGYDLRASPDRCPECGMEFEVQSPK